MELKLVKTKNDSYKLISTSNKKSEALEHIAELLQESNKSAKIKIGVYSIYGGEFSMFRTVYSYIADRAERMSKKKFYKFIKGKAQLKGKKPWASSLARDKKEKKEFEEMFN